MYEDRKDFSIDLRALARLEHEAVAEAADGVRLAGIDLMGQAINRAPVAEGTLRGSASVHFDGGRVATGGGPGTPATGGAGTDATSAAVVFNSPYAAIQHEDTSLAHPKGGEAKYLERPFYEGREAYTNRIAARVGRVLK